MEEESLLLTRISKYSSRVLFVDGVAAKFASSLPAAATLCTEERAALDEAEVKSYILRAGEVFGVVGREKPLTTPQIQELASRFAVGDFVKACSEVGHCGAARLRSLSLEQRATEASRELAVHLAKVQKSRCRLGKLDGKRDQSKTWERRKPVEGRACKLWLNEGRCTRVDATGKRWCRWEHPEGKAYVKCESVLRLQQETQLVYQLNRRVAAKLRWLQERKARRRREAKELAIAIGEETVALDGKMSKRMRSKCFVDWLVQTFSDAIEGEDKLIVDVAGGRGDISSLLRERGIRSVVVDPRRVYRKTGEAVVPDGLQVIEPFSQEWAALPAAKATAGASVELMSQCTMLIGMHPDRQSSTKRHDKPQQLMQLCFPTRQNPPKP